MKLSFILRAGFLLFTLSACAGPVAAVGQTIPDEPAAADESMQSSDDAGAQLRNLLADMDTFVADVRQLVMEATGSVLEESQIVFKLRRPDGFYWETLEPFPELIVTDGSTLWNYQPDLLQLTIDDWQPDESELAAQLLSGRVDAVLRDYSIDVSPVQSGGAEFYLYPRAPSSLYEQVILYFEGNQPASLLLISTNGQRTFWEFNNRRFNPPLSADEFVFQVPDDELLDVIDNRLHAR